MKVWNNIKITIYSLNCFICFGFLITVLQSKKDIDFEMLIMCAVLSLGWPVWLGALFYRIFIM